MRVLLALALMVYGEAAGAACSTALLAGSWNIGANGLFCSIFRMKAGRGTGPCIQYDSGGSIVGQPSITVILTADSDCTVSGKINGQIFIGKMDRHNLMMISGVAPPFGQVTMVGP